MKMLLLKIPKPAILTITFVLLSLSLYPQTFATKKEFKKSGQHATKSLTLRDALLRLKSRYHANILFEEKILDGLVASDSLVDYQLAIDKNLKTLLYPSGLGYQEVKKNTFVILNSHKNPAIVSNQTDSNAVSAESLTVLTESYDASYTVQIKGQVTDEDNQPMPGVNLLEKGTINGTVTDNNGEYTLNAKDQSSIIVFSFVGYTAQEIVVGSSTQINVSLKPDIKSLEEIVVIGYGTREKKDITGSIVDIKSSEIVQSNALSPQLALQGRMTGVLVTGGGGDPNARPNINIRGVSTFGNNAQPLYIIDGIPVAEFGEGTTYAVEGGRASDLRGTQNILNLINPNDIESISVLKDASSAAVYGVRAANGVILITTKRGKEGKPKIDFSANYGVRNLRTKLDMLNTQEYTSIYRDQIFANDKFLDPKSSFLKYYNPTDPAYLGNSPTYDWQSELINKNALTANYTAGISGGNEFAKYNVGTGFAQQEGSLKFSSQDRYSFSINTDFKVKPWLEVGETFRIAYTKQSDQRNNTGVENNITFLLGTPPWQPIYDDKQTDGLANADVGKFGPETGINFVGMNKYTSQKFDVTRTLGNAYLTLIPLKGLRIKGTVSVDNTDNKRTQWNKGVQTARFNPTGNPDAGNQFGLQNTLNYTIAKEFSINYNKALGDHHFDLLLNASDQQIYFDGLNTGVSNITLEDPNTYTLNAGVPATVNATQFKESIALQGYLARISYKFKDKYYLDGTIMRNGSSRFDPKYRWGVFPAVSAAWRISGEEFMQNLSFITDLKLRGGWGQLGNQDTRSFAYLSSVNRNSQYSLGASTGGGTPNTGAFLGDYANSNLTWEKVTTSNIGIDASLFNSALTLTVEYYSRKTDGILQSSPFPATAGLTNPPVFNVAKVSNTGIELAANYRHRMGDIEFNVGGNITTVKNEVLDLFQGQTLYNGNTRIKVGQSINSIYGFQTDGIFQTTQEVTDWLATHTSPGNTTQLSPGDFRFKDLYTDADQKGNPDGVVNGFDQTYLGKTIPGYYYGITLGANYKGFDLNVLFQGVGDVSKINYLRMQGEYMGGPGNNWLRSTLNYWTPENKSNTTPRPIYSDPSSNGRFSDRWVESGAFLRLNNAQLGYTIPKDLLAKIGGISSARFYLQTTNTFVITKYTGLDPENDSNPTPRAFVVGLNASF